MFLHNQKRKAVGMIMAKMGPDGKDKPLEPHAEPDVSELHVLAGHVRRAVQGGSDAELANALRAFFEAVDLDIEE